MVFKSLQVVFAVLIVHFMLKITGAYGRNTMIAAAFVLALVMIGGLGYLVAYNNMAGGTSTAQEQHQAGQPSNSIDQLFASDSGVQHASLTRPAPRLQARHHRRRLARAAQTVTVLAGPRRFLVLACLRQRGILHRDDGRGALHADVENNVRNFTSPTTTSTGARISRCFTCSSCADRKGA